MIVKFKKGEVKELTKSFNLLEFHCHCTYPECTFTYLDLELVEALQKKRDDWGKPIHIDDGYRCHRHNDDVDGKPGSQHLIGKAADIKVEGMTPSEVALACEDFSGLGRYKTFTHVDIRHGMGANVLKARWHG